MTATPSPKEQTPTGEDAQQPTNAAAQTLATVAAKQATAKAAKEETPQPVYSYKNDPYGYNGYSSDYSPEPAYRQSSYSREYGCDASYKRRRRLASQESHQETTTTLSDTKITDSQLKSNESSDSRDSKTGRPRKEVRSVTTSPEVKTPAGGEAQQPTNAAAQTPATVAAKQATAEAAKEETPQPVYSYNGNSSDYSPEPAYRQSSYSRDYGCDASYKRRRRLASQESHQETTTPLSDSKITDSQFESNESSDSRDSKTGRPRKEVRPVTNAAEWFKSTLKLSSSEEKAERIRERDAVRERLNERMRAKNKRSAYQDWINQMENMDDDSDCE